MSTKTLSHHTASSLDRFLFTQVDNSPLVIFRMAFGFLLFIEAAGAIALGWVRRVMIAPDFTFNYIGFEWIRPLPGNWMYAYFGLMALCGLGVMLGYRYRVSAIGYFVLWTFVYLMQKSSYNNHYYLMVLLTGIMPLLPAHRTYSLDARRDPSVRSNTCPRWCHLFFIFQVAIVYFYAAVHKLYPDWLDARPMEVWFSSKGDLPIVGALYTKRWFHYFISYGGILFDASIVPLLLFRRTRVLGFCLSLFFHLFNSFTFGIGVFPYMAISLNIFFFNPETIRRIFLKKKEKVTDNPVEVPAYKPLLLAFLSVYFAFQLLLPVRHVLFPGQVHWTEEGHRLSWQMMLRTKYGTIFFRVKDKETGRESIVIPINYLTDKQARKLPTHPDMIYQFVQVIKKEYQAKGQDNIAIYAVSKASLNGRKLQTFVDPEADLAQIEWEPFGHITWIKPLEEVDK